MEFGFGSTLSQSLYHGSSIGATMEKDFYDAFHGNAEYTSEIRAVIGVVDFVVVAEFLEK